MPTSSNASHKRISAPKKDGEQAMFSWSDHSAHLRMEEKRAGVKKTFAQRSKADQKLLLHQAAALLVFLEEQGLKKCAFKLRKGLEKDIGLAEETDMEEEGDDDEIRLPDKPKGKWKFIKADDYDSPGEAEEESSEGEESSEEEEESSSGEYESTSEEEDEGDNKKAKAKKKRSSKVSIASSASEYEEEITSEEESSSEEEEDTKPKAKAKKAPPAKKPNTNKLKPNTHSNIQIKGIKHLPNPNAKRKPVSRTKSLDKDSDFPKRIPKRGVRRSVSFDAGPVKVVPIPNIEKDDVPKLYYNRAEIKQMRKDKAEEEQLETERKLKEAMEEAQAMIYR